MMDEMKNVGCLKLITILKKKEVRSEMSTKANGKRNTCSGKATYKGIKNVWS